MTTIEAFPIHGQAFRRIAIAAVLIAFAGLFLSAATESSIFERQYWRGRLSPEQNLGVNLLFAFAFITLGVRSLVSVWRNRRTPNEVRIAADAVSAPFQGVFGDRVEIAPSAITSIAFKSRGGQEELLIVAGRKTIRIPQKWLVDTQHYDMLRTSLERAAPSITWIAQSGTRTS